MQQRARQQDRTATQNNLAHLATDTRTLSVCERPVGETGAEFTLVAHSVERHQQRDEAHDEAEGVDEGEAAHGAQHHAPAAGVVVEPVERVVHHIRGARSLGVGALAPRWCARVVLLLAVPRAVLWLHAKLHGGRLRVRFAVLEHVRARKANQLLLGLRQNPAHALEL